MAEGRKIVNFTSTGLWVVLGVIGVALLATFAIALTALISTYARTGTCDGDDVCARVRALEGQSIDIDLILAANTDLVTITPDATPAGDAVVPTDPEFRILCDGVSVVVLARATPAEGVEVSDDSAYLWFGAVSGGEPVLTPFPADGKLHAVTGTFSGIGNHPTAIFADSADGRIHAQLEGFVYVDSCP